MTGFASGNILENRQSIFFKSIDIMYHPPPYRMKRIVLSSAAEITMLFGEDFSLGGNQVLPVFEGECLNK